MRNARVVLAALGASIALAVISVAAAVAPTAAQVTEPTTMIMKQNTSWLVKCGTKLSWQRETPKSGRLTCAPSTNVTTTTTAPPTTTTTTATPPPPDPPPAGCELPSFPDASCTGVPSGTQLEVVSGDVEYSFPCALPPCFVQGKEFRGCVAVKTPGLTIRNSRFVGHCSYQLQYYRVSGDWLRVEDSTFVCANPRGTAIGEERITALRLNISGCENGLDVNHSVNLSDSYVHDLYQCDPRESGCPDPHGDDVQMWSTATDVTIRHNTLDAGQWGTSAIISPQSGTLGTLIQDNLLSGGAASLYCRQDGPGAQKIIGNRFSTKWYPTVGFYFPWTDCEDEALVSDNRYHDGEHAGELLPGHP